MDALHGEGSMTTAASARVLDVRFLAGPQVCEAALRAFDALAPGEALALVAGGPLPDVVRRLQAERKGLFEWSLLEGGPARFRFEVTRRRAQPGDHREISEALAWDHDRLDALEVRAFERHGAGDAEGARAAWAEFAVGLRRHIRFEEEIVFPAFEERTGVPPGQGPTAVMRAEHREIEGLLEDVERALAGMGAPLPFRDRLHEVLGEHNLKEEQVLYPLTDESLGPDERDALVARIQTMA
jgi:uncharacterized protein (DUF2249 family)/hemerythrin-like domain-containing protein